MEQYLVLGKKYHIMEYQPGFILEQRITLLPIYTQNSYQIKLSNETLALYQLEF